MIGPYRAKRVLKFGGSGGGGGGAPIIVLCLYAPRSNLSVFPTHFRISFGALS